MESGAPASSGSASEPGAGPDPGPEPGAVPGPGPDPDPGAVPGPGPGPKPGDTPEKPVPQEPDPQGSAQGAADPEAPDPQAAGAGQRSRRRRRWVRRGVVVLVLLLLVPLLGAEAALRVNYSGDPADGTYTRGQDAIWLGHAWVDGRKTDADVTALAERLRGTGIRDLYVHTGPLEHDGTLPKSVYPKAGWFIAAVHRALPGVRVQAWLGDVLASESPDGLRLERARTRAAVVASAREVLAAGYEGAHFDLEPLHSGDRNYLGLLDDLRAVTRAHGALLSVASHQIDPLPAFHSVWGALTNHPKWWSQAYFGEVARRVDQIAVMSYDTMQPLQSLYGGYVAQQTSLALEVTPPGTQLLMGLPFYHENKFGHQAHAETVPAAVRGVRLGLSRTDADRARFGVALYVDFAATEADWTAYREDWVHR
ncbi:membrane protein [Streptomyces sp. e14]|uniref:membrane protein n=1 Tax=Streptomyces sp. e14 TaxID=645465 RepID=UPI0001D0650C|nr:membrane protein [Streptomyces sp. e14]EFF92878.1 membrane protein [Streptomyces sp. e14]